MIFKLRNRLAQAAVILLPLATIGAAPAPALPAAAIKPAKICGWVVNPTPANWSIIDRRGEWTIGVQGGYQAPGNEKLPDYSVGEWVARNGSYGYGCGCITADVNARTKRVTRIYGATQSKLAVCKADRKLPKPE